MTEQRLTLGWLLRTAGKFWWLVVVLALAGAAASFGYASTQTPMYRSTASLHFALNQGSSAIDLNQGSAYTQSQMLSYAQLVQGSRVLDPVAEELDLDLSPRELSELIEVSIPQDTVTMRITATTSDPQLSAALATSVSENLIEAVQEVAPADPTGAASLTVVIYDDAVPPQVQSSPDKRRDAMLGGAVGGAAGLPVLGTVSRSPLLGRRSIAMLQQRLSRTTEEFLRIRSTLSYADVVSRVRVLLVTACRPGEGKSTISVNLAMAFAGNDDRVLLIDADLRRPRAHEYAGIDGSVGLTEVLLDEVDVDVAVHRLQGTDLDLLPAGKIPPNPAEMLTSPRFEKLVRQMAEKYSYVIIDSPPVLSVADATLLSPIVDGVVLTVDATRTRRAALSRSVKMLDSSGARMLGTVLNRVKPERSREGYYEEDPD